jgi:hypothetical protein
VAGNRVFLEVKSRHSLDATSFAEISGGIGDLANSSENSPAFQGWVKCVLKLKVPTGTAENGVDGRKEFRP